MIAYCSNSKALNAIFTLRYRKPFNHGNNYCFQNLPLWLVINQK